MNLKLLKYFLIVSVIIMSQFLQGCLFEFINQPKAAQPGEVIDIQISIYDNLVPENNAHKGILGIIAPEDWTFISGDYASSIGNGALAESAEWKDSVDLYFPITQYGKNMKWIVLLSDKGYTYQNPVTFLVNLKIKTGQTEGCFNLGYLTTKATSGLLNSGNQQWCPLSFPHPIGIPDSNLCVNPFETRKAPEWDSLLDRKSGWTGADGIYSIPHNESEQPSENNINKQLILFSDTFIGEVNDMNRRVNSRIVNNTLALMNNTRPAEDNIEFFWSQDSNGTAKTIFVPETPNAKAGDWYWLMDGISINDTVNVFALRLNSTGEGGGFGFEVNGAALLKFTLNEQNFIGDVEQFDTPLYYKNETEGWDILFGQAIMPMTTISGNPSPDGYIYIYGPKGTASGKELVAARVLPPNIGKFNLWEYWDGTSWGNSIENCASITSGISQEFSVTPIGNNKYLLVVQAGNTVAVRIGESPVGPFGILHTIYECPEVLEDPDIFVYNAKAHPSLSTKEELLISYNVNSLSFNDLIANADIYRPRFIYLKITDSTLTGAKELIPVSSNYLLKQNYPNPFNPVTNFGFRINNYGWVTLKIYDVLGKEAATLVNEEKQPGEYEVRFNATSLASGIYYYRLQSGSYSETKKMILLK